MARLCLWQRANTIRQDSAKWLIKCWCRHQRCRLDCWLWLSHHLACMTRLTKFNHISMQFRPIKMCHDYSLCLPNTKMTCNRNLMSNTQDLITITRRGNNLMNSAPFFISWSLGLSPLPQQHAGLQVITFGDSLASLSEYAFSASFFKTGSACCFSMRDDLLNLAS